MPAASSSARISRAFSMMPLCTSTTRLSLLMCGCALFSVTPPWVAPRVWPMEFASKMFPRHPLRELRHAARCGFHI